MPPTTPGAIVPFSEARLFEVADTPLPAIQWDNCHPRHAQLPSPPPPPPRAPPPVPKAIVRPLSSAPRQSRRSLSQQPRAPCQLPAAAVNKRKGKGAKHANKCAGPWSCVLDRMPPPPLVGAKRARAGLADVPFPRAAQRILHQERAARSLVAILPAACAAAILTTSQEYVDSLATDVAAEAVVGVLSKYGVSALSSATSSLGPLIAWIVEHHPSDSHIHGAHLAAYLDSHTVSASFLTGLNWVRDYCGLELPVRSTVTRPYRSQVSSSANDKESFSLRVVLGFEEIAATDKSHFVSGQAAAFYVLAVCALRLEQSSDCILNAIVDHLTDVCDRVLVVAARRDKNPDPSKMQSRPVWGVITGVRFPGAVERALVRMLSSTTAAECLLPDTDSPSGDPRRASMWLQSPLPAHRVNAALHSLLMHPCIGMSPEQASHFHGHSAKRFLLNVAEAAPSFSKEDANEIGRFSSSTSQDNDLSPVARMLERHDLACSVLPDIYSGTARVENVFERLARVQACMVAAAKAAADDLSDLPLVGGFTATFRGL